MHKVEISYFGLHVGFFITGIGHFEVSYSQPNVILQIELTVCPSIFHVKMAENTTKLS